MGFLGSKWYNICKVVNTFFGCSNTNWQVLHNKKVGCFFKNVVKGVQI